MSHQPKVYYTRKRRHYEEIERQLMEQNAEFQTKIIDLNNDCLEKIFMYLDIHDFTNIAHTNKELKPAADMAFARKFGKKTVDFFIRSIYREDFVVEVNQDMVGVFDFHTSLRLLRCFGHLISRLIILPTLQWTAVKIIGYANEYCSKSLLEIMFFKVKAGAFEELKKPFAIARYVVFLGCTIDGKLAQLSNWFPRMHHLQLEENYTQLDHIYANSPDLREMIVMGRGQKCSSLTNTLRLGPGLRYLHLNVDGWVKFLQSKRFLGLDYLYVVWEEKDFRGVGDYIFNFDHLSKLQMIPNRFAYQSTPKIPISFPSVQELTWEAYSYHPLDQPVIEFFTKHSTITKLTLKQYSLSVMNKNITPIARALPLLQEINFESIVLSVDELLPFINEARLLKNVGFHMTNRSEFERLKMLLDKEWQASIDDQRVELKLKG